MKYEYPQVAFHGFGFAAVIIRSRWSILIERLRSVTNYSILYFRLCIIIQIQTLNTNLTYVEISSVVTRGQFQEGIFLPFSLFFFVNLMFINIIEWLLACDFQNDVLDDWQNQWWKRKKNTTCHYHIQEPHMFLAKFTLIVLWHWRSQAVF